MLASHKGFGRGKQDIGFHLKEQLQEYVGSEHPILVGQEKPWASVTFSGTRYRFSIPCVELNAYDLFLARMGRLVDHEFELPGYFVADILVRQSNSGKDAIELDILAIADPVSE